MHVHEGFHEIFKYAHLKFTVCGRSIDSPTYTCVRNAVTLVWGSLRLAPIRWRGELSLSQCKLNSFNPKHCTRRSVRGEISKNNYVKASATPNDRVKLPNQRRSHFSAEKYVKEGKRNLRGERNEVRADERQTCRQQKILRLKITADKVNQPSMHAKLACETRWK